MSSKSKTPQLNDKELNELTTSDPLVVNIINKWAKALGCWIIISLMGNIIHLTIQYCIFKGTYNLPQEHLKGEYLGGFVFFMAIINGSSIVAFVIILLFVKNPIGEIDFDLKAIHILTLVALFFYVIFTMLITYELYSTESLVSHS